MKTALFDYNLPKNLIADSPASPRDHSRLMIIDRKSGQISHHKFFEIEKYLGKSDVLVLNKTKVFPARIFAKKVLRLRSGRPEGGGKVELLFIKEIKLGIWKALTHPGLKAGTNIAINKHLFNVIGQDGMTAIINTHLDNTKMMLMLNKYGTTPLPPYINSKGKESKLRKEYQTVYAKSVGSVAAPTAGFHFTEKLLNKLKKNGIQIEYVTLHVGLGTFLPIKTKNLEDHLMHTEYFEANGETIRRLNQAKKSGKRIVAVGTTTTRVLETLATNDRQLKTNKQSGTTNLFMYPPRKFNFVDALITNFHLPDSTLLALVSAFVSYPNTKDKFVNFKTSLMGKAYKKAIKEKYRFFSFGDACLII